MRKVLKMEMYEFTHDPICLFMLGIMLILGMLLGNGYLEDNYLNLVKGGYEVFISMLYDSTAFIIFISIFTALLIGKSFSNRTIALKIISGNSRKNVFLSKVVAVFTIAIISMFMFPILGALTVTIKYGWNSSILQSIITLLKIIICTILLEASIFSVVIFIGILFRDTVKTVTTSAIITFFNALYMASSNKLNLPISMHPMRLLRTILANNSWSQFIMISLYSMVLLSVILLLSYNIFRKCELK